MDETARREAGGTVDEVDIADEAGEPGLDSTGSFDE